MSVATDLNRAANSSYATLPSLLSLSTGPLTPLVFDTMHRFYSLCVNVFNKVSTVAPAVIQLPYLHNGIEGRVRPDT